MLAARCSIGVIGFITFTIGVPLVPLVVQNTIFNTAPFWASLLGYIFLSEAMSPLEIAAMIMSFGGVVLIAMSDKFKNEDEVNIGEVEPSTQEATGGEEASPMGKM